MKAALCFMSFLPLITLANPMAALNDLILARDDDDCKKSDVQGSCAKCPGGYEASYFAGTGGLDTNTDLYYCNNPRCVCDNSGDVQCRCQKAGFTQDLCSNCKDGKWYIIEPGDIRPNVVAPWEYFCGDPNKQKKDDKMCQLSTLQPCSACPSGEFYGASDKEPWGKNQDQRFCASTKGEKHSYDFRCDV